MKSVKSARRTLEILELITARETSPSFTELAGELQIPRSSLHGLLWTMVESGWVQQNPGERGFSLGVRALEAGNAYLRTFDLPERAKRFLRAVCDQIDETVQLSILDGRFNVYVAKVEGRQPLRLASEVGRRLPAHATGHGKVLLAYLPSEALAARFDRAELESFTSATTTSMDSLQQEFVVIRRRGYALDRGEYSLGVSCLAVPVHDQGGGVVAAMGVSAPTFRFDTGRRELARKVLADSAASLSIDLGYTASVTSRTSRT